MASSVTDTGAAPAAAFAGPSDPRLGEDADTTSGQSLGEPRVSRLTPTLSGGSGLVSGDVELEAWVTSVAIYEGDPVGGESAIYRGAIAPPDGPLDAREREELGGYLDGEPMVGERFAVCVPDAEVPGGNGSIAEELTPRRLVDYLTGRFEAAGRVYSWGDADADGDGVGDCDDEGGDVRPGTLCGTTPHFLADTSGPTATGGGLAVARGTDGTVTVTGTRPGTDGGPATVCASVADDDPCGPGVWARTTGSGSATGTVVSRVLVQPPECPHPFPALLYVQRCRSDDQLVFTGGWVVDEAALYADSSTVLSMATETQVVPVGLSAVDGDADGDGLGDVVGRSVSGPRALRGARIDSGTVTAFVESGVLSSAGTEGIRKRPGRRTDGDIVLKHVAVDAPVLHLVGAARASRDVKFKAGAELSKSVN